MKKRIVYHLLMLLLAGLGFAQDQELNWLNWSQLPSLPAVSGQDEPLGVAGAFAGVHNDALIVAGGANFPKPFQQTQKTWHRDIHVLEKNSTAWLGGFSLDKPLAYGASVSTRQGLVCIGGNDAQRSYDGVFLLQWDPKSKTIVRSDLPSLPQPCSYTYAACISDVIYVAGGQLETSPVSVMRNFWRLDLSKVNQGEKFAWEPLPAWPGPARAFTFVAAQHNGREVCIYVIGGRMQTSDDPDSKVVYKDVYEFSPSRYDASAYDRAADQYHGQGLQSQPWKKCSDLPAVTSAVTGIDVGQSHILIFCAAEKPESVPADVDREGFSKNVLAYHTITDTYIPVGQMPIGQVTTTALKWDGAIVVPAGEIRPRVRTPQVWKAELTKTATVLGKVNTVVLTVYLLGMLAVGVYFMRRNRTTEDFFRGGKRIPAWVAGLSIFSTLLSSITFIAIPAKVYMSDWTFITINIVSVPLVVFVLICIVPYFRRIDVTSAYEYLERRFNVFLRLFAAFSFVLYQTGRMAIVMFLPALALSTMTSMPVPMCILLTGVLTVAYCTMGGMEAVVWTDAIQSFVLLGGAIFCLVTMIQSLGGGFSEFVAIAGANAKFHAVDWDFSRSSIYTTAFWVMILGGLGQNLVPYVSDQAIVQRYVSVAGAKQVKDSLITSTVAAVVSTFLFFGIGTALFVFYKTHPTHLDPTYQNDAIFPLFISNNLPVGLGGLVIAGIYAAAQSTVSGSIHSISTVVVTDFVRRFSLMKTERGYLILARICTFIFGTLGTILALLFSSADIKSLWEAFISVLGLFGGSMCGVFLLGMFTRRVGGLSAMIGALSGAGVLFAVSNYTRVNLVLYASIGIVACFVTGYLASFIFPCRKKELSGLTIHS